MARRNEREIGAAVDEEIAFHLDMRAEALMREGLSEAEARAAAQREFGEVEAARRKLRRAGGWGERRRRLAAGVDDLRQDVRFAWRGLRRSRGFTLAAVTTLALGIGANTAVFTLVDAVLLRALPYADPDRLVNAWSERAVSPAEFVAVRDRTTSFTAVGAHGAATFTLTGSGDPVRAAGASVTAELFDVLGARPALGRAFAAGEDQPGGPLVAVLSHGLWQRRFGGDPRALGAAIEVDGQSYAVIGVMAAGFAFPDRETQLWIPVVLDASRVGDYWAFSRLRLVGRLRPGATAASAQQEMRALAEQVRFENPLWNPGEAYAAGLEVTPLREAMVGPVRSLLLLLFATVATVLLIACVNVANLLLARAAARGREIAVRSALGAGRLRLARQLVTETVLLALVGAAAGIGVAAVALRLLLILLPANLPRVSEIAMDGRVLLFTTGVALVTGVLLGLLPALRTGGIGSADALRQGSREVGLGAGHRRLASGLVAAEIALGVVLVIGAGLLTRSFAQLVSVDPGYATEQLISARVDLVRNAYPEDGRVVAFYESLLERAAALPGVEAAAAVDRLPLGGQPGGLAYRVRGQLEDFRNVLPTADYRIITPAYFAALDMPLLQGRAFTTADRAGSPDVAIVSQSLARQYWPGEDPVGKQIGLPYESPWITVVGVVPDVRAQDLAGDAEAAIYRPFLQAPARSMALLARGAAHPGTIATALRGAVAALDPQVPVSDVRTMEEQLSVSIARPRGVALLLGAFAAIALVLAAVGIYGVIAYGVAQRSREIGLRMALGARENTVQRMIVRQGAALAAAGAGAGLLLALGATRFLGGMLFGVSRTDPLTFLLAPLVLGGVALLASWLPARRAARIDPMISLRSD